MNASSEEWTMLPEVTAAKQLEKIKRDNASYAHFGGKRVVISGGEKLQVSNNVSRIFYLLIFGAYSWTNWNN